MFLWKKYYFGTNYRKIENSLKEKLNLSQINVHLLLIYYWKPYSSYVLNCIFPCRHVSHYCMFSGPAAL